MRQIQAIHSLQHTHLDGFCQAPDLGREEVRQLLGRLLRENGLDGQGRPGQLKAKAEVLVGHESSDENAVKRQNEAATW